MWIWQLGLQQAAWVMLKRGSGVVTGKRLSWRTEVTYEELNNKEKVWLVIIYYSLIISRSRWFRASWGKNSWVHFNPERRSAVSSYVGFVSLALTGHFWCYWCPFKMKHKLWSWCVCVDTSIHVLIVQMINSASKLPVIFGWHTWSFAFCMIQNWVISAHVITKLVWNQAQLLHNMQHSGIHRKTNPKEWLEHLWTRWNKDKAG